MRAGRAASRAANSASQARRDARRAYDAAIAARKDANEAIRAAQEAYDAAFAKAEVAREEAKKNERVQCGQYLIGTPGGREAYRNCLEQVDMTPSDMVKLAYRNVGLCTTLYPNHESVLYINCTRNVLDPAFETNQMVQLAQFFAVAAEGFAKIMLGVTASFVLVVGGITCVLAAPCAAAAAVIGEVLGPILSPELIGLPAVVIGGGVAVAEIRVVAMLEARLAAVEVRQTRIEAFLLKKLRTPPCASTRGLAAGAATVFRGAAGVPCGIPNATRLSKEEQETASRLTRATDYTGGRLSEASDRAYDYVDQFERSYDAIGVPKAYEFWNPTEFFEALDWHVKYKQGLNFTVLDLTGASPKQLDEIFVHIDRYTTAQKKTIILVGD